ncbi:uncharacterized protein [Heptranchias perlo]|uniref:uncharacterized protein n=1 Tax=Heptranchias perlo TaxID=212740 RepID=UPI003559658F
MMVRRIKGIFWISLCIALASAQTNTSTTLAPSTTVGQISSPAAISAAPSTKPPNSVGSGNVNISTTNLAPTGSATLTTNTTETANTTLTTAPPSGLENTTTVASTTSGGNGTQATATNQTSGAVSTPSPSDTPSTQPPTANTTEISAVTTTANITGTVPSNNTRTTDKIGVFPKRRTLDAGLVALIVILVIILIIGILVTAVKYSQQGKPEFKRLQELPMNSLSEDAPFAQYPPK